MVKGAKNSQNHKPIDELLSEEGNGAKKGAESGKSVLSPQPSYSAFFIFWLSVIGATFHSLEQTTVKR